MNIHDANIVLSSLIDENTIEVSIYDDGHIEGRFNLEGKVAEVEAHRIAYKHETRLVIRVKDKPA
jgi:hypothetical protein